VWPLILASQELPHSHDCRPSGLVGMILETAWTCPGLEGGGAGRARKQDAGTERRARAICRRKSPEPPAPLPPDVASVGTPDELSSPQRFHH
jgi:hypothetical protein